MKSIISIAAAKHKRKIKAIDRIVVRPGSEELKKLALKSTNKLT